MIWSSRTSKTTRQSPIRKRNVPTRVSVRRVAYRVGSADMSLSFSTIRRLVRVSSASRSLIARRVRTTSLILQIGEPHDSTARMILARFRDGLEIAIRGQRLESFQIIFNRPPDSGFNEPLQLISTQIGYALRHDPILPLRSAARGVSSQLLSMSSSAAWLIRADHTPPVCATFC
jgi:hypothetical protein